MRHAVLEKHRIHERFERCTQRLGLPLFLMLAPLGVFAALTFVEVGYLSPLAITSALATYALVLSFGAWTIRRVVAQAMGGDDTRQSTVHESPGC